MMHITWTGDSSDHNAENDTVCSYRVLLRESQRFASGCGGTYVYYGYFGGLVINTKLPKIAIKSIQLDSFENETLKWIENEPNILMELSNPNILRCHWSWRDQNNFLFIVTELCAGTLEDLVEGNLRNNIEIDEREILHQITGAVVYLHEKKIVHRDIKPDNIFITHVNEQDSTPPQMKLADFGQSISLKSHEKDFPNELTQNNSTNETIWGTMGWRAPELKDSARCDFKIDIFSLGLIFAYTLVQKKKDGRHPFNGLTIQGIINQVGRDIYIEEDTISLTSILPGEELMESYSSLAIPLIEYMMKRNPTKRPTADEVVNDNFFTSRPILAV